MDWRGVYGFFCTCTLSGHYLRTVMIRMNLRTRLTLWFTFLTAIILAVFAVSIYMSAHASREKEFFNSLQNEAITKCNLIFSAGLDPSTLQKIYQNNRLLQNEAEVAIYDTSFNLLYHDAVDIDFVKETPELIRKIAREGIVTFYKKNWQVVGIRHQIGHHSYIITAAAYDRYGYSKLRSLIVSMIAISMPALLVIWFSGMFLSKKALDPVKEIISKAQRISATNLHLRLPAFNARDELSELARTFNDMLTRIENSFESQKAFISNIAHEVRTPLTTISAEIEYLLHQPRSPHEYHETLQGILADTRRLSRLISSLMDFARAGYDESRIAFKPVRIDEILLDARKQVAEASKNYTIHLQFDNGSCIDTEAPLTLRANEYLLRTAFVNIIDNACKFSPDHTCRILISCTCESGSPAAKKGIKITFSDSGPGIPEEDLEQIFTPFYRGANKHLAEGSGIGLPLTRRIIDLHRGRMELHTSPEGTTITLYFS